MQLFFGIILLIAAVFLIIAVLMQQGKASNLSGSIAGGAETFFGKSKGKTLDKALSKLTTVVAIVFTCLIIFVYVIQKDVDPNSRPKGGLKWALSSDYVNFTPSDTDTDDNKAENNGADTADDTAADDTAADDTAADDTAADDTAAEA